VGNGWDQNDWAVKEFPSKDFDKYFPNTPVVLNRIDGHTIVYSKALALANITKDTKVSGGQIKLKWRTNRIF
jgi:predicted amidohydrolase YtcJ